ncbi:uncharacterized protein [Pyxicephalus adspersus]|uniref:uncharacterized protein isoform X3 n=1 Tax=Pyxicephalus adspersus TaxID=30357 RepID=UPI003B5A8E25
MNKDRSHMTERILNLTLEIIYLLTGESFHPVKSGDQVTITVPPPHCLTPEKLNNKKILEVIQNMTELLTGEVPIRCQDVTVHFSMEEWEYLEGHKDLFKDVMMKDHQTLTSPDGSSNRNPPARCPHPLYSQDSIQEDQEIPHHHQIPSLKHPKRSTAKKAKTDSGRSFQKAWTETFGVIECNGKALCILCNKSVVCRTSSVKRHLDTNHKSVAKLDLTLHFEVLNKQLQGLGKTAERMFFHIKTFEKKLQVFETDLESGLLKYFTNLKTHLENSTFADKPTSYQEIYKEFSSIVAAVKVNFSNRFLQFHKMETTLCFLTSPDKANFEELDLSCLHWLDLENLEMELLEFQESSIWKNKFYDLRETLEKMEEITNYCTGSSENKILKVWNSLPNKFKSMKALGIALLTLFGSSYACERLFSALNDIKSDTKNGLTDDLSAACVVLKLTKYRPRLDKLLACMQQQQSH